MNKYPNLIEAGLKVGDIVDGIRGELTIKKIASNDGHPIKTVDESFTEFGMQYLDDKHPSIWFKSDVDWFSPPMSPPEPDHMKEFYTDRPVWVRDSNDETWKPRYAALYMPSGTFYQFRAFDSREKQANAIATTGWTYVAYTKPEGAEDHE